VRRFLFATRRKVCPRSLYECLPGLGIAGPWRHKTSVPGDHGRRAAELAGGREGPAGGLAKADKGA